MWDRGVLQQPAGNVPCSGMRGSDGIGGHAEAATGNHFCLMRRSFLNPKL